MQKALHHLICWIKDTGLDSFPSLYGDWEESQTSEGQWETSHTEPEAT